MKDTYGRLLCYNEGAKYKGNEMEIDLYKQRDIFIKARAVLLDKSAWTQFACAKTKYNSPVSADNPSACKFCTIGALEKACIGSPVYWLMDSIHAFKRFSKINTGIGTWNDARNRTHKEVLETFDKVIAACDAELDKQNESITK